MLSRAREKGLDGEALTRLGEQHDLPEFVAAGRFLEQYLTNPRPPGPHRLLRPDPPGHDRGRGAPRRAAGAVPARLRRRVPGHRPRAGGSAAHARRRRARPGGGGRPAPVDLRVPRAPRCAASWSSPPSSRAPTGRRPTWWRCGRRAGSGRGCCSPRSGSPGASRCRAPSTRRRGRRSTGRRRRPVRTATDSSWCAPTTPSGPRPSTSPTCCGGPTSRTACPGTRWRSWFAPAASRSLRSAGRSARPASRSRSRATRCRWSATRPSCRCSTRCAPPSSSTTTTPTTRATSTPPGPRRCSPARSAGSTPATSAAWPGACAPENGPPRRPRTAPRALARAAPRRRRARVPGRPGRRSTGRRDPRSTERRRVADLARAAARAASSAASASGGSAEQVLWRMWTSTDWPERLRRGVDQGGATARRAHRDLDAICALFDVAARVGEQRNRLGVREFVDGARRPGDPRRHPGRAWGPRRRRCGCSPPTGPRAWSGGWSSSRTCSRRAGPTCAGARRSCAPTASAATPRSCRRSAPASCCSRSAGSSTSPARAPASGSSSPRSLRPTTTASSRPGSSTSSGCRSRRSPAARPDRCRWPAWSASCGVPSPTPRRPSRSATRPRDAWPGSRARPAAAARWCRRPTRRPGGARAPPRAPSSRCETPTARCRSRRPCSRR